MKLSWGVALVHVLWVDGGDSPRLQLPTIIVRKGAAVDFVVPDSVSVRHVNRPHVSALEGE